MKPMNDVATNPSTKRAKGAPIGNKNAQTHGLNTMRKAVTALGSRAIPGNTPLGYALKNWKTDLINDLGGRDAISTQQLALVELAAKSKLLLDSIDAWLLTRPTLINARKKSLLPVVRERQALADGLARYLTTLGLERRQRDSDDLQAYVREKYGRRSAAEQDSSDNDGSGDER